MAPREPLNILGPVTVAAWAFNTGLVTAVMFTASATLLVRPEALTPPLLAVLFGYFWQAYLVDRLVPQPEDLGADDATAAGFAKRRRPLMLGFLALAIAAQVGAVLAEPPLFVAIACCGLISLAYLVPIPGLGRRVKEIPLAKPVFLGVVTMGTVTAFVAAALGPTWDLVPGSVVGALLIGVNTALYDLKDLEADRRAGVPSPALVLGVPRLLRILLATVVIAAGIAWGTMSPGFAPLGLALATFYAAAIVAAATRPFDAWMAAGIDGGHVVVLVVGWAALG